METEITKEEIGLLNALYWWQMTGSWPRVNKKIFSSWMPRFNSLPKEKHREK